MRIWRQLLNKWERTQERPNWRGNARSATRGFSADGAEIFTVMDHERATISSGHGMRTTCQRQYNGKYFLCPTKPCQVPEYFNSLSTLELAWIRLKKKKGGNALCPSVEF